MADELFKYFKSENNRSKVLQYKKFLSAVDFDKLIKCLRNSSNEQLIIFEDVITNYVYNFANADEFFECDVDTIKNLISELNEYLGEIECKKIRSYIVNQFINALKNIFLKFEQKKDYMMFLIGIHTGLRISDILRLKAGDVKNRSHICIIEKKTKKAKKFLINTEL